jgi:H+/Cl- antiporter ClcA
MYGLMGLGALVLVVGSFYLGCLLFREYQSKRNQPLLLASALGLTIGSVLTLVIAGYLSSGSGGLMTTSHNDSLRFPLFGWYLNGQDLRIPHFFATHMMQLIPLYGLWLSQKHRNVSGVYESRLLWTTGVLSLLILALFALAVLLK